MKHVNGVSSGAFAPGGYLRGEAGPGARRGVYRAASPREIDAEYGQHEGRRGLRLESLCLPLVSPSARALAGCGSTQHFELGHHVEDV